MLRLRQGDDADGNPTHLDIQESIGPEWPVWAGYKIAQPGDRAWWLNRDEDWSWTGGVLTSFSAEESPGWLLHKPHLRVPRDELPPAGYRPDRVSTQLLNAALKVDVASPDALLGFVRTWGLLGVGTGLRAQAESLLSRPGSRPNFDTVWATRRALAAIQEHYRWLLALKKGQWSARSIPRAPDEEDILDAARVLMPEPDWRALEEGYERDWRALRRVLTSVGGSADPYVSGFSLRYTLLYAAHRPPAERAAWGNRSTAETHWHAFSISIAEHLRRIHPAIRWEPKRRGPVPTWWVRAPIDALWAAVWTGATGGEIVMCPGCHDWFSRSRKNQEYCTDSCANRARFRRWYAKQRPRRPSVPKNVPASTRGRVKSGQRQPTAKRKTRR